MSVRDVDEQKRRLIETWPDFPQHVIGEAAYQWRTRLRARVKEKVINQSINQSFICIKPQVHT